MPVMHTAQFHLWVDCIRCGDLPGRDEMLHAMNENLTGQTCFGRILFEESAE